MKRQTDSLRHMRLSDKTIDLESSSEEEDEFSSIRARQAARALKNEVQEVVESRSTGGHVSKKRTKSRPVSL